MNGYHFFAVMPDERKSKSASKAYPMQPWTRATLRTYAEQGRYVECLAVASESYIGRGKVMHDCIGALMADNDQAVCGATTSRDYLRDRCTRIDEALARKLHPALFRQLAP
jgi:hypothetical protein